MLCCGREGETFKALPKISDIVKTFGACIGMPVHTVLVCGQPHFYTFQLDIIEYLERQLSF